MISVKDNYKKGWIYDIIGNEQIRRSGKFGGISAVLLFYQILWKSQNGSSDFVAHWRPPLLYSLWNCL